MKTFTLLIFGICLGLIVRGQVVVTELISSGGNGFANIAWSAGESITESFKQDGIILNHGFHHGEISVGLGDNKIYLYYTNESTYRDKPYRLIIAKIE
ncbi:MAG: hypothetical protein ACOC8S_06515 [Bacteroidota bacterium]